MRIFVLITLSILALVLVNTSCQLEEPFKCLEFPSNDIMKPVCEKCWESDEAYNDWFDNCWVYALIATDSTNPSAIEMAADSLCACE